MRINKGDTVFIPGATPADRYDWLMAWLSPAEQRAMQDRREARLLWLRLNNPDALRDAA